MQQIASGFSSNPLAHLYISTARGNESLNSVSNWTNWKLCNKFDLAKVQQNKAKLNRIKIISGCWWVVQISDELLTLHFTLGQVMITV